MMWLVPKDLPINIYRMRCLRHFTLDIFLALAGCVSLLAADGPATFTNPVAARGQDPWVIRWQNHYLFCQSKGDAVYVNRTSRLEDIGTNTWKRVWQAPKGTAWSKEVWAPELHYIQGKWYIYVAADDGVNDNHRMYVLEGSSDDPQAPFTSKGKIAAPTDHWAIDGTVLEMPDAKLYFIWSGWKGPENGEQDLYIAPMSNPWTISSERVLISRPDHPWEHREYPRVNEGPETLWHDSHLFIIYSASGCWGDNYCLGQLTWTGGDVMDPKSWVKNSEPVFTHTPEVSGPGHCSFTQSPDGKEDWLVYHAHITHGNSDRDVRIQRFRWNPDGSPDFGAPIPPGVRLPVPSGE